MFFVKFVGISALRATALAASLDISHVGRTFTLEEIPIDSPRSSISDIIRTPYFKFGLDVPADIEDAMIRDVLPGQSSIPTKSVDYDQEYGMFSLLSCVKLRLTDISVISVQVGNQILLLNLDTGSSDLYVIAAAPIE
jgi:hypothetical protein